MIAACLLAGALAGPARAAQASPDALPTWVARVAAGRSRYDAAEERALEGFLEALDAELGAPAEELAPAREALLDVVGWELDPPRGMPEGFRAAAGTRARRALAAPLRLESRRAELLDWLTSDVLLVESAHPLPRRWAVARVLAGSDLPGAVLALFTAAEDAEPRVAGAALDALVGMDGAAVDRFLVDRLLEAPEARRGGLLDLLARHLDRRPGGLGGAAADRLAPRLGPWMVDPDWRTALKALRLARPLDTERAVPLLIESLETWARRGRAGGGSLRVEHALAEALGRRSGRALGRDPGAWSEWWRRARAGELVPDAGGPASEPTVATFFSLRPRSDRVLFVLDRSGSMERGLRYRDEGERTRYAEAMEQLDGFLERAGESTEFGVVLFSGEGALWRRRLTPAVASARRAALRWIERNGPGGETRLAAALETMLELGGGDPAALPFDTVVVLCDGETTESAAWARRWLSDVNPRAELVFHCVQLGVAQGEALRALARETGGDWIRVGG